MSNNYKIMNNATPQLTIRSETIKEPTVAIMGINMLSVLLWWLNSSSVDLPQLISTVT